MSQLRQDQSVLSGPAHNGQANNSRKASTGYQMEEINGDSASTVVAKTSSSPVMHRKMANGMSQRLSESLCHNPPANWAMDPNMLANTINPRRVLPRFLITSQPPSSMRLLVFLSLPMCASLRGSLQRPEHRSCSAGMLSSLQLHD